MKDRCINLYWIVYIKTQELFDLIDAAYNEDLSNQPDIYKSNLLKRAGELESGKDSLEVMTEIFKDYPTSALDAMSLPDHSRKLYMYVNERFKKLTEKELRDLNLGVGLIATSFTFGSIM